MKHIAIILCLLTLASCGYNKSLKSVIADFESTPECDTTNILLHPNDTKKTLAGKVVVLNSKIDCYSDSDYIDDEKIDSYKNL